MPSGDWNDLGTKEKAAVVGFGAVQILLLASALVDIYRRPSEDVRGWKSVWVMVSFVNMLGPIAYFIFGRRK